MVLSESVEQKEAYLRRQFTHTYLRDIKERNGIQKDDDLEELVCVVASCIGGLINPIKLENTFHSVKHSTISRATIKQYLDHLQDSFMIERSVRYDIKGRSYIDTPSKYYFCDVGVRNACLNFRQTEFTHLMENVIYAELRRRGHQVDVGQLMTTQTVADGKRQRVPLEIDFVCNRGYRRAYVQSALALPDAEKAKQELRPFGKINDGFAKVLVLGTPTPTYQNDEGVLITNIHDFLLRPELLPT